MTNRKWGWRGAILLVVTLLVIGSAFSLYASVHMLQVEAYTIHSDKISGGVSGEAGGKNCGKESAKVGAEASAETGGKGNSEVGGKASAEAGGKASAETGGEVSGRDSALVSGEDRGKDSGNVGGKTGIGLRIVQLTDLHNSVFGENNAKLIAKVREQEPDLILITGDLLNEDEPETAVAEDLIQELAKLAPVYFSYGNHEAAHEKRWGTDLTELFTAAGAQVLDFSYTDLEIRGTTLRLGGLYGYCLPAKYLRTHEARENECRFLEEFQDTERYTLLMCHMPVCWLVNDGLEDWQVDCVLAGHAHGGQLRMPLIGGLWAPDQGWFPGREAGLYRSEDGNKALLLSRGLGSTEKIPRFNNIPEILVLDLLPE